MVHQAGQLESELVEPRFSSASERSVSDADLYDRLVDKFLTTNRNTAGTFKVTYLLAHGLLFLLPPFLSASALCFDTLDTHPS